MTTPTPINPPGDTSIKYYNLLALGDSYTIGESVPTEQQFPRQAIQMRAALRFKAPNIIARTGWTTTNLLDALAANPPATNYDFVTLLIGVNNQYQNKPLQLYTTEFQILLNDAIKYAGGIKKNVTVLSIPDYSVTQFALNYDTAKIRRELDEYNAIAKNITKKNGVKFLDITAISREARYDKSLIAGDGLHPSGAQYKRWAMLLAPLLQP